VKSSPPPSSPLFGTVFAIAFAVAYVVAVESNVAVFTYHPITGELDWGVKPAREGPAMYWYGWLATAGLTALVVALAAKLLPERVAKSLWPGWSWLVPLLALLAFVWLLKGFFLR
jgi:hypothetical protein